MQKIIDIKSGIYLLEINALSNFNVDIKKFDGIIFEKGYYYYSGSAQKNFNSRITRHLRNEKNIYWHIDYLTTSKYCEVKTLFLFENGEKSLECELVRTMQANFPEIMLIKGFGNGDCDKCESHLLYSKRKINHNHFSALYQSAVLIIASSIEID
ncbi:MAG: GIY-YIG nuclease family protein [Melioribacteraceae bacterium]|nr:GIY-YIG nuclease family protein [Melioribacteraceae bacterium]